MNDLKTLRLIVKIIKWSFERDLQWIIPEIEKAAAEELSEFMSTTM